jgi:hypothetical protein
MGRVDELQFGVKAEQVCCAIGLWCLFSTSELLLLLRWSLLSWRRWRRCGGVQENTFDITADMTRQYKAMQEELLGKINDLQNTINDLKDELGAFDVPCERLASVCCRSCRRRRRHCSVGLRDVPWCSGLTNGDGSRKEGARAPTEGEG